MCFKKLILPVFFSIHLHAVNATPFNVEIRKDSFNNAIVFILYEENLAIDSTKICNVNIISDSLTQLNDSVWHYFYCLNLPSNESVCKQILIEYLNKKIIFSYASIFYNSLQPTHNNEDGYFWNISYQIHLSDSSSPAYVNYFANIKEIDGNHIREDTLRFVYYLQYNPKEKVYYTQIDTLNGEYTFFNDTKYVFFNNEIAYSLEIRETDFSRYTRIHGVWFILYDKYDKFISNYIKVDTRCCMLAK